MLETRLHLLFHTQVRCPQAVPCGRVFAVELSSAGELFQGFRVSLQLQVAIRKPYTGFGLIRLLVRCLLKIGQCQAWIVELEIVQSR